MRRALFLLGALLAGTAVSLPAQTPAQSPPGGPSAPAANGEIRGAVMDAGTNTPIARASVTVRTKADNALVAGAIAGTDGTFRIQGLRPGDYTLRTTYL